MRRSLRRRRPLTRVEWSADSPRHSRWPRWKRSREHTFRRGHHFRVAVLASSRVQRKRASLKNRLRGVMGVARPDQIDVGGYSGVDDKGSPELLDEAGRKVPT